MVLVLTWPKLGRSIAKHVYRIPWYTDLVGLYFHQINHSISVSIWSIFITKQFNVIIHIAYVVALVLMKSMNVPFYGDFELSEIVIVVASDESNDNTQSYANGKPLKIEEQEQKDSFTKEEKMR